MFERFQRWPRATLKRACEIAQDDGATTVEAHHVLLAIVRHPNERTEHALDVLGLTEASVRRALQDEFVDALRTAGVHAAVTPPPERPVPRTPLRNLKWGRSASLVLERAHLAATDRGVSRVDDGHLLLAVGRAKAGVIPGVLANLGVASDDFEAALNRPPGR